MWSLIGCINWILSDFSEAEGVVFIWGPLLTQGALFRADCFAALEPTLSLFSVHMILKYVKPHDWKKCPQSHKKTLLRLLLAHSRDRRNWGHFHSCDISWGEGARIAVPWWGEAVFPRGRGPTSFRTTLAKRLFSGISNCVVPRGGLPSLDPGMPSEWRGWVGSCSPFLAWLPCYMCGWGGLRSRGQAWRDWLARMGINSTAERGQWPPLDIFSANSVWNQSVVWGREKYKDGLMIMLPLTCLIWTLGFRTRPWETVWWWDVTVLWISSWRVTQMLTIPDLGPAPLFPPNWVSPLSTDGGPPDNQAKVNCLFSCDWM